MRRFYARNFLAVELALSVVMTLGAVAGLELASGPGGIAAALRGSRQALYAALASTGGSLLGFILTAATVVMTVGQLPRFNLLREAGRYEEAFRVFFQAIGWLAVGTTWSLVGLVADTDAAPKPWVAGGMLWLVVLGALRVYRCVWLLQRMATIAARRWRRGEGERVQ